MQRSQPIGNHFDVFIGDLGNRRHRRIVGPVVRFGFTNKLPHFFCRIPFGCQGFPTGPHQAHVHGMTGPTSVFIRHLFYRVGHGLRLHGGGRQAKANKEGLLFFGTSAYAALEATDRLEAAGVHVDTMRLKAFPFNETVREFINSHESVYVVEQNRDAQMRSLLLIELGIDPKKLISVLNYDGFPITAGVIVNGILKHHPEILSVGPNGHSSNAEVS